MTEVIEQLFKLTPQGIHLLRNKYSYKIIEYSEVNNASLINGRSVKNWKLVFVIGFLLFLGALLFLYFLFNGLSIEEKDVRFYNMFGSGVVAALVLGVAGIGLIFNSIRTVPIIIITTKESMYKLRVLKYKDKTQEIIHFLSSFGVRIH